MTSNTENGIPMPYLFGRWNFNTASGDLFDGETTTRLEPQVAKLLGYFLARQHVVISRDELIAAVWENRIVSDDAINRCVSILRQILSPEDIQAYIETVVRKGYIAHFPPAPVNARRGAQPLQRPRYYFLAALAGAFALLLYWVAGRFGDATPDLRELRGAGPPMVAVLPFASDSRAGGDSEFFADGIHDDLLTQLAKLQSMRVISSTSVKEYRNTERNMREIGKELGADVVLEGRVQLAGNRIRINAQLIDARTDEHLWAENYDRELSPANIFDVQSEIALAIAEELHTVLTAQDSQQLAMIPTNNMAAYRAYHRAMELRKEDNAALGSPEYLQALEEAVELDPAFSRAWAQLVNALALNNFTVHDPEITRRTEQALESLRAVAPGSVDYLMGLASYVYYALQDYDQAHDIISQALKKAPGDIQALELKTWIERRQGDFDASLETKKEMRRLDPRNPNWTDVLVHGLLIMHRYDEARAEIATSLLDSFSIEETANLLRFRDDRDYRRWQESMQELCELYAEPDCGWEAHIANRDYTAALDSLGRTKKEIYSVYFLDSDRRRIMTHWLMTDAGPMDEGLLQWQDQLERDLGVPDNAPRGLSDITLAMLAGIQGDVDKSERLIQLWLGPEQFDWADRTEFRHEACRVFGLIAATQAAVKCIRDGLSEPSHVHPFLEPYLPFYDTIRDQPEFIEMLAEIDPGRPSGRNY